MPGSVEAMVLTEDRALVPRDFARPPVGADDGLLRVELAGICRTDAKVVDGSYPAPLPLITGHEIAGRIEEVGERAACRRGVAAGDRVVVEPVVGCGTCRPCRAGETRFRDHPRSYGTKTSCDVAPYPWGACSPLMHLAADSSVHRVPDGTSAELGMRSTVAIANGLQWTLSRGGVVQGHDVVVQGVGPIGRCCVAAARAAGARRVNAVGLSRDVLGRELAPQFGADVVVAADEHDVVEIVRATTDDRLADVVVDTTGSLQALRTALDIVRRSGTVVSGGITGSDVLTPLPLPMDVVTVKEIRLQGVFSFDGAAVRRAIELAADGRFPFERLITHRYDLRDAAEAVAALTDHTVTDRLKVVLVPRPSDRPGSALGKEEVERRARRRRVALGRDVRHGRERRAGEVLGDGPHGQVVVAGTEGPDERLVVGVPTGPRGGMAELSQTQEALGTLPETGDRVVQHRRRLGGDRVERAVLLLPGCDVLVLQAAPHPGEGLLQPRHQLRRRHAHRDANRHGFQGDARRVDRVDLTRVDRPDDGPLVGLVLDQSLLLQEAERLAQRGAADVESAGECSLQDRGARRQLAVEDHRADRGVDVHGQTATRSGGPGGGGVGEFLRHARSVSRFRRVSPPPRQRSRP